MPLRMLLLIFWTTLCAAQTSEPICVNFPKTDWELDGVRGRVKVVRTFRTTFGKDYRTGLPIGGDARLEDEAKYDAKGKRTYWFNLLPAAPDDNLVVEYDCDGPTRIKEIRSRGSKDPGWRKTVYSHDENGRITQRAHYFADGTLQRLEKYQYDEKGNRIEEIVQQKAESGHHALRNNRAYDTSRRTFGYDSKRNKTSETYYREDGSFYFQWVFEYDSRNNLIKDTRRDDQGRLADQYIYKYDRRNKLVEERHYANFCVTRNNQFCKGTVNSGDGEFYYLTTTLYEYDRHGNWVRQREFRKGGQSGSQRYEANHILLRRFTYYK